MNNRIESKKNRFLKLTPENGDFNQYWFSEKTIEFFLDQVKKYGKNRIGFIATPSIFFSLSKEDQEKSFLFDIDEKLTKKHKNGKKYDFNDNNYQELFPELKESFDFLVIDPPFITEEAWTKFSKFAHYLKNKDNLNKLLGLNIKTFQPSIPHLVYQYNIFANYDDEELDKKNPEIIE